MASAPLPRCVRELAGDAITLVWRNERGRMIWARAFTCVPEVLDHGRDDEGAWMLTLALAGDNAVAPRWIAEPAKAVAAIGSGLRAFHEALPVDRCPFSWSIAERLADIDRRERTRYYRLLYDLGP